MSYQGEDPNASYQGDVPEALVAPIANAIASSLTTPESGPKARTAAVEWLTQLFSAVRSWHSELLQLLEEHPGRRNSTVRSEYRMFYRTLAHYRYDLDTRTGYVKSILCDPIELLQTKFDTTFAFLKYADENAFYHLKDLVDDAFLSEAGLIESAQHLLHKIMEGPELGYDYRKWVQTPGYIQWQVDHRTEKLLHLDEYVRKSANFVERLKDIAKDAHVNFLGDVSELEEIQAKILSKQEPATDRLRKLKGDLTMEMRSNPQRDYPLLYTIMAFGFGIIAVAVVIALAWYTPNPSVFQVRVYTSVLAVALGGVATVMSGLLKADLTLGKQLKVGATGALAVFVLTYFFPPA